MAYRYAGVGGAGDAPLVVTSEDPKYADGTTTDPKYPSGGAVVVVPGPADLRSMPNILPPTVLPTPVSTTQAPVSPTLPPMISTSQQSGGGFITSSGLFGVEWKWWLLGGIAVLVVRSASRPKPAVTANRRRVRRNTGFLVTGSRVHGARGAGTIVEVHGENASVRWDSGGSPKWVKRSSLTANKRRARRSR